MQDNTRILIVEDLPSDYGLAQREIHKTIPDCSFERAEDQAGFLKALQDFQPHVILSDYTLPTFNGMQVLELAQQHAPFTPIIIWTGSLSEDVAVECMKMGASNYVIKDNLKRLGPAVAQALKERKALLESRQAEEKYQAIIENSPVGIFQSSPQGQFLSVNSAMAHIYGFASAREMIESIHNIADEIYSNANRRNEFLELLHSQGFVREFENENRRKDGSLFWTSTSARVVRDAEGNVLYYEGFLQDITERKQVDARLRTSESRYRLATRATNDVIWEWDIETNQLSWSENAQPVFGYSLEEIGPNAGWWDEHIHPDDYERVSSKLNVLIATVGGETFWSDNYRFLRKNGSYACISDHAYLERNSEGKVIRMMGAMSDITERKKAEEELARSERRFRALIENGLDDISLLSADGKLLWESPAVIRNLGYAENEYLQRNIFELMHPNDLPWTLDLYTQLVQNPGERRSGVFRLRHADGTWRWMEAIVTNMLNDPAVNAIVVNYRDVTERKRAEEALRVSEERFRVALKNLPIIVFNQDRDLRYTWIANPHPRFSNESILGKTDVDLVGAEEAQQLVEIKQNVLASGVGTRSEVKRTVGETTYVYDLIVEPLHDSTGSVVGVTCASLDITDRKQVEESLLHSQQELAEAQHIAKIGSWSFNPNTQEVRWSDELYTIFDIEKEHFDHTYDAYLRLVHPEDQSKVQIRNTKSLEAGNSFNQEYRIITPRGETKTISEVGYARTASDGKLMSLFGTAQDVTKRRQAEIERQALLNIMQGLAKTNDLTEFLKLVHQAIGRVITAENFFVMFYHQDTGMFEEIYCVDQYDPPAPPSTLEKSITSYVFRTGEPILLTHDGFKKLLAAGEMELVGTNSASWLGAPLKTANGTIGVMAVQDYENPDRYSEHDKDFFASIATQAALAIDHKRTEDAEREQRALAETLRDTAQILSSTLNYGEVLDQILASVGRVVAHDAATIMLIENGNAHVARSRGYEDRGFDGNLMEARLSVQGTANLRQIFETQKPVIVEDTQTYPDWKVLATTEWMRSNVGAPICIYGEVIGFILLDSETPGFFKPLHMERLQAFANQAALAIHNARLLQTAQQEIAERRQAEDALRKAEIKYRSLVERLPVVTYTSELGTKGGWSYVSPQIEQLLGFTSQEWMANPDLWYQQMHPEDRDREEILEEAAYQRGEPFVGEYRIFARDGSMLWVRDSGQIISIENGSAPIIQGVLMDITERKRAEEGLLRSEKRYRTVVENQNEFIVRWKPNGVRTFVNDAYCRYYGITLKQALSASFLPLVHEEDRPHVEEKIARLLSGSSRAETDVHRVIKQDGSIGWNEWTDQAIYDENGQLIEFQSVGRDITERRKAEQELLASEERFRQLANNIEEVFWVTDAKSGREIYMSPAVEKIWGLAVETLLDEPDAFMNSILPEDLPTVRNGIEREKSGEKVEMEYRITRPDGSVRWIWDRGFPIFDEHGTVKTLAGIAADITERKQSEEQVRRLSRAVEQSASTIVITDAKGNIEYVNSKFTEITGYTFEEAFGQNPRILKSGHTPRQYYEELWQTILSGKEWRGEIYNRKKNGELFWEHATISPILNEQGKITHFVAVKEDITERKLAEIALLQSQARYYDLFDSSPISLWEENYSLVKKKIENLQQENIANLDEYLSTHPETVLELASLVKVIDVNKASLELYHVQQKEDLLKNLLQITSQETLLHFRSEISGLMSSAGKFSWEGRDATMDGEPIMVMVNGSIAPGFESDWSKVIISITNITERKRTEEALRESEERFGRAFEFAPIGMALVSLDGHFVKVNNSLSNILGYTKQELLSKTFQEITYSQDLEMDLTYVNQILAGETVSYQMEKRYIHKSGHLVWVHLSVTLVRDNEAKPQYFISQIQDITERKRAEEEIRRRAEETGALLQTSLALTNLDLNAILQSVGSSAKSLFTADGCRIFLMQPDGETLRCVLALQENSDALINLKIKLGEGVTGVVAVNGQAEIVNDMQHDTRSVQIAGTPNEEEEAIMFAPLREREHTIGVLSIRRAGSERPFNPDDLELLEAFASMAASAVSNARLFGEAQRRLSELEALYENGLAVGQLLEPSEIGARIIETFARHLSWHHVVIRLLQPGGDNLEVIALNQAGLSEELRLETERHFNQMVSKVGRGLSGRVVQTGTPLRTGNVHQHVHYVDSQEGIQSGLYMPLKIGDRVIGVISVESEVPDAFTEQDERLLATLGNQAAVAFENARLYQAAHQEIMERGRAQAALWASETHYRQLADSITDILFELDHNLRFSHWNKASEMFSGIPAEDAIGKSMSEVWGGSEQVTRMEQIFGSVLVERQAISFESEGQAQGKKYSLEVNAYPSARGVSVVAKDISRRKLDETLLRKRFELMEYSAHHSLDEVMRRTIDYISELTESHIGFLHFVEADETTLSLQTWSTETLGHFCEAEGNGMHYPLDQAGVWADAIRQRKSIIHNDYKTLPDKKGIPEGHALVIREMVIPIIRSEKVVAVLGVGNKAQEYTQHDIEVAERFADYAWDTAERKQMETVLADERIQLARRVEERTADLSRANSNLARALRVKDEFLANMSHELRTPLNAILGLSESLGEQTAGPLNEKQQKYLTIINESGHHLLSLINDILDLAKIEAGQITLDITTVNIATVCETSLRMIKQLAQKKNQEVEFTIDENMGLIWADERRLKQMVVNLLSNAVKFTPEGGTLGLEVHGDHGEGRVIISVWDKGIGISQRDLDRLFRPFVQLDSGLAREATGTGLGLALVAQMARLHGGSVNVESVVGEGSRFSIHLPWEPAAVVDASVRLRNTGKFRTIDPHATNKPTILLVEDTREVVLMLVDYLEMAGFKVVTAQDGIEGLEQAKLVHPDLILMDVQMPRMDGFETTEKLRSDPDFKDTPIIALTALAMPNDRQRCLDAGMNEYISKPVNLRGLVKIIKSNLFDKEGAEAK